MPDSIVTTLTEDQLTRTIRALRFLMVKERRSGTRSEDDLRSSRAAIRRNDLRVNMTR